MGKNHSRFTQLSQARQISHPSQVFGRPIFKSVVEWDWMKTEWKLHTSSLIDLQGQGFFAICNSPFNLQTRPTKHTPIYWSSASNLKLSFSRIHCNSYIAHGVRLYYIHLTLLPLWRRVWVWDYVLLHMHKTFEDWIYKSKPVWEIPNWMGLICANGVAMTAVMFSCIYSTANWHVYYLTQMHLKSWQVINLKPHIQHTQYIIP